MSILCFESLKAKDFADPNEPPTRPSVVLQRMQQRFDTDLISSSVCMACKTETVNMCQTLIYDSSWVQVDAFITLCILADKWQCERALQKALGTLSRHGLVVTWPDRGGGW